MKLFTYWSVESLFSRLLCNVRMMLFGERYVLHIHSRLLSGVWLIGYTGKKGQVHRLNYIFFVRLKAGTWNITIFKHIPSPAPAIMCIETYIHDYTDWSVYLFIFYLFSETGKKKTTSTRRSPHETSREDLVPAFYKHGRACAWDYVNIA